jgi:membrane protein implicated in regulation of membrane protease activity
VGVALTNFTADGPAGSGPAGSGQVRVGGEIWEAESTQDLQEGERVVVKEIHGLKLAVEREQC